MVTLGGGDRPYKVLRTHPDELTPTIKNNGTLARKAIYQAEILKAIESTRERLASGITVADYLHELGLRPPAAAPGALVAAPPAEEPPPAAPAVEEPENPPAPDMPVQTGTFDARRKYHPSDAERAELHALGDS